MRRDTDKPMTETIDQLAAKFAQAAHEAINQRRKYSGRPYFEHPARVAAIVRCVTDDQNLIAAAYLHDVVEDVNFDALSRVSATFGVTRTSFPDNIRDASLQLVEDLFGRDIALLVEQLSDVSKPEDGNRKARKAIDREHLKNASPGAKTVKLADLIDNAGDIAASDHDFAIVYYKEKALLLPVLKEGNQQLWERAYKLVQDFELKEMRESLK
jgi:(p)ppGpp synthase/HD superfamily hydrolase